MLDLESEKDLENALLQNEIDSMSRRIAFWESEYKSMKKIKTSTMILRKEVIQAYEDLKYIRDQTVSDNKELYEKFGNIEKIANNKLLEK